MRPSVSHVLLGLAFTAIVGGPTQFLYARFLSIDIGWWHGFTFTLAFYASRERRQSEEFWGSNRIPPWQWKPRALRDIAYPVLASAVLCSFVQWAVP
jgi:hypothetical protein